jgi:hypothetical protein
LRGVPAWALKSGAVCLTLLTTVGAAAYVGENVKNQSAPLRPRLQPAVVEAATGTGPLSVAPGARAGSGRPVTETYVS